MAKAYILTFDRNKTYDYKALHDGLKKDHRIYNWSHYLLSSYLITSDYSASELTSSIKTYFPNHRFLVLQIHPTNYSGWLPTEAWTWLKKYIGYP